MTSDGEEVGIDAKDRLFPLHQYNQGGSHSATRVLLLRRRQWPQHLPCACSVDAATALLVDAVH